MAHASPDERYDQNAARLPITVTRGDDVDFWLDAVSEHESLYAPGEFIERPVDISDISWDSAVFDATGKERARFVITDHAWLPNRVRVFLSGDETGRLAPGTYRYWIEWLNVVSGVRRTRILAPFEVRAR
jgi:hypothetical protein